MRSLSKAMIDHASNNKEDCHYSIYNLEIDKKKDLVAISNRVCSFSISSLHKICELLLLSGVDEYLSSLADGGNYGKRSLLEDTGLSSRLLLCDLFAPEDKPKSRFNFTMTQSAKIGNQFASSYASFAAKILLDFLPNEFHHEACEEVQIELAGDQSNRIQSILFDGQGQQETIREFQKMISDPLQVFPDPMPGARFKECKLSIDKDADSVIDQYENISLKRASKILKRATYTSKQLEAFGDEVVKGLVDFLWDKKFKSVAFQSALVMTPKILFESFDSTDSQRIGELFSKSVVEMTKGLSVDEFVDDYLEAMNAFFAPTSRARLRDLLQLFNGRWADGPVNLADLSTWKLDTEAPGPRFGSVVTKSMDPKHWCAYRYILLEVYRVNSKLLNSKAPESQDIGSLLKMLVCQIDSLRRVLVRKVYREVYAQNSDSPNISSGQIQFVSRGDCVRRINAILNTCGVPRPSQLTESYVSEVVSSNALGSGAGLDSYGVDEDEDGDD